MKKLLAGALLSTLLLSTSCMPQKTLYSWSDYDKRSYDYVKDNTEENLDELLQSYEKMINNPNGTRKAIAPGICADYGYLLVKKGRKEEGIKMLKNEIALYPESTVFISRIIKQLEK